jgi:Cyclic-phosphate processing Receiver domain
MRILFLDDNPARHALMDKRHPDDEVVHAYTIDDYRDALVKYDHFDVVSLDHDLNDFTELGYFSYIGDSEATGVDACGYLMKFLNKVGEIIIHSSNGTGARNMMDFLDSKGVSNHWAQSWRIFNDNQED